ncbi:LysR substrate-binding domain-containing protein [Dyella caseinilytica]|uniref:LysR family transcriptional regulator n=1 Tax=Dyella caseinilytica TaxID=1849581 RepID=A0ABX7GTL6_9GAMM|nr:LysR substrate-binding domain-containing protein [Dyella caseinilytica]QRN53654.1 LysR family transcriptional regulator [Dyella caseinilytica]GFZ88236.1 transcriptional regulator [Dyella caseinilytica]
MTNDYLELRHLKYFVTVADELHFGRAAERLGISQPPLSQQIHALELRLGAKLFERKGRGIALSHAGTALLPRARGILAQAERAAESVARSQRGEIGELHMGLMSSGPFTFVVPRVLARFRQRLPDVRLLIHEMATSQQIDALEQGIIDVGVIRPDALPESICAIELFKDSLTVVMHASNPLAATPGPIHVNELAREDFIFYQRHLGVRLYDEVIALCTKAGFSPRILYEVRELPTIIGLISGGFGVAVLPGSVQRMTVENVVYRPVADMEAATAVWAIYRHDANNPIVDAFLEIAQCMASKQATNRERGAA